MKNLNKINEALEKAPSNVEISNFEICDPALAPVVPLEFVVDNMVAKGLITVIAGSAGSGKSFIVQYLLQTRSSNILNVCNGKAFYLTGADASDNEIRLRARKIKHAGFGGLLTIKVSNDYLTPLVDDSDFMELLIETLIENEVDAIVFDTLRDYFNGDSNEAATANKTMSAFKRLAEKANVAVILITHTRKSVTTKTEISNEDVADSRIFTTKADFVFGLQSEYQNDETSLVQIVNLKTRSSKPLKSFRYRVKDENLNVFFERTDDLFEKELAKKQDKLQKDERNRKIRQMKVEGHPIQKIADDIGVSRQTIYKVLNEEG